MVYWRLNERECQPKHILSILIKYIKSKYDKFTHTKTCNNKIEKAIEKILNDNAKFSKLDVTPGKEISYNQDWQKNYQTLT